MNLKPLRERWDPEQIASLEAQLLAASRTPKGIEFDSPFGVTDAGFLDLRGVPLSESVRYTRLRRADFSGALFREGASLTESELTQCVFDRADIRNRFVSRRFTGCGFVGAKLQQSRLGTVFTGCDFTKANLSGSVASGTRFERCDFTGARLGSIMWTQRCVFDHCVFDDLVSLSGSVAGSVFIGTAPESMDRCITDHIQLVDIT